MLLYVRIVNVIICDVRIVNVIMCMRIVNVICEKCERYCM